MNLPIGMTTPRAMKAMQALVDGVANKRIWNVDFKEASDDLNREFEKAVRVVEDEVQTACRRVDPEGFGGLYGIANSGWSLTYVRSTIKAYEKWLKNPQPVVRGSRVIPEMIAGARRMLELTRSWVPIEDLKKAARAFIIMGRKPSEKPAEERYVPPRASLDSLKRVEKLLRDLIESKRADLEKMYTGILWHNVLEFFAANERPDKFFKKDPHMAALVKELAVRPHAYAHVKWTEGATMRPDTHSIVRREAKKYALGIVNNYVSKNLDKLTRPIAEREAKGGKLVKLLDLGMYVRGDTFSGTMALTFSDGTGFKVLNKMVHKKSSRGWPFVQFPTTFHEVVFRNGAEKAMQSEEQMNKDWLA